MSRADISRKFGASTTTIRNHMDSEGVEYGALSESIRLKVQKKLVEEPEKVQPKVQGPEPRSTVKIAA